MKTIIFLLTSLLILPVYGGTAKEELEGKTYSIVNCIKFDQGIRVIHSKVNQLLVNEGNGKKTVAGRTLGGRGGETFKSGTEKHKMVEKFCDRFSVWYEAHQRKAIHCAVDVSGNHSELDVYQYKFTNLKSYDANGNQKPFQADLSGGNKTEISLKSEDVKGAEEFCNLAGQAVKVPAASYDNSSKSVNGAPNVEGE